MGNRVLEHTHEIHLFAWETILLQGFEQDVCAVPFPQAPSTDQKAYILPVSSVVFTSLSLLLHVCYK